MNPYNFLIALPRDIRTHTGERIVSLINGFGKDWISICRRMKLTFSYTIHTKISSQNGLKTFKHNIKNKII
jgi:hypothetical protein